jgi:hypothetical protein
MTRKLSDEQADFLLDFCKLIVFATERGFKVTGGELQRTPEQQALYVKAGRSTTMESNHLRKCAGDLNFILDNKLCYDKKLLQPIGDFWEALHPNNRWGGNWKSFKDLPHFERHSKPRA